MQTQIDEASDYDFIIRLIYDRCRIRLHDGKHQLIKARLGKRMRQHGFETLAQYCHYLRRSADEDEFTHLVDALTTNYTQFLRERDHFEFLVGTALPKPAGARRDFRVWSAACATGEEPYSMAFYLSESFPPEAGWDWRITASDISTKALTQAAQGIYPEGRLESLPLEWRRKYLQKGQKNWEGHYRVKPQLMDRVLFRQINLLGDYGFRETFEVIFCRNVMIYFDRPTQEQLVQRLAQFLVPGGYLLIGHSESLHGLNIGLRCLKPSIYQNAEWGINNR
jgi:chemotaxis protein methyltransferase CheR